MESQERKEKIRIAVFASGNGSNAKRLAEYFHTHDQIEISLICCNNPNAFVLQRAQRLNITTLLFDRPTFYESDKIMDELKGNKIDWIVLAGFLWLIPDNILNAFSRRIINIHPALLPAHGGKGMYGSRIHEAVLAAGEKQSGITIHYVNEKYDEGNIIFQATCCVDTNDSPELLAQKIHQLEYEHYPKVIEKLVQQSR